MESTSCRSAALLICSSEPMDSSAGAMMDEQSGERKAKPEMIKDV